jgi:hypothetical protein
MGVCVCVCVCVFVPVYVYVRVRVRRLQSSTEKMTSTVWGRWTALLGVPRHRLPCQAFLGMGTCRIIGFTLQPLDFMSRSPQDWVVCGSASCPLYKM